MSEREPKAGAAGGRAAALKEMALRQARSFLFLFLYLWGLLGLFLGPALMAALALLWQEWTAPRPEAPRPG